MAATLKLEVATPDGLALSAEVEMVTAPSVNGEFGVLPGHLPLLAATKSGLLKYRIAGRDEVAAIGPGFVEALPDKVLVLTDSFVKPASVNRAEAEKDLAAAERGLAELKGPHEGGEYEELKRAQDWARARLDAAKPN
jgi:F-type H+-transporting ATPase subunit epsilon